MKKQAIVPMILATSLLFASCSSSTLITSSPSGAQVYLNGEAVGTTPYDYSDTKIVGSTTNVKLEKDGYETLNTSFSRSEAADVGAIVAGCFVLVPFLWTMKYKPEHAYKLAPLSGTAATDAKTTTSTVLPKSKTEELRNLKQLLDDKAITPEEFEKEKKKILDN